ncbi:MAG: molybdopterin molybdotransferase MoeA, partial [Gammaproteobacteria bacterium]
IFILLGFYRKSGARTPETTHRLARIRGPVQAPSSRPHSRLRAAVIHVWVRQAAQSMQGLPRPHRLAGLHSSAHMISYDEALTRIAAALSPAEPTSSPTIEALDQVTSQAVHSRMDVPDFDNTAMDGIAVRSADMASASADSPVEVSVTGTVAAGEQPGLVLEPQTAVEIMTGAPLPVGADAVIPIERITMTEPGPAHRRASVTTAPDAGANVRRAGEDIRRGDLLLAPGTQLTPESVMNLSAAGVDSVDVHPMPRVAVITTGRELASAGSPSGTGMIRDSNGPYLAAALPMMGAHLAGQRSASDELSGIVATIRDAMDEARIIVTTGGVSAGRFDCVPAAVTELGGEILFHKVAIRPGKPVLFARLPDDRWLFGLPGNPVAVAVGLRFFVAPALRALRGLAPEQLMAAQTTQPIGKRAGLRFFGKANAQLNASGQLQVSLLTGQESFRIQPLLRANCWAVVKEGLEQVPAGDVIQIAPLFPTRFLQPMSD